LLAAERNCAPDDARGALCATLEAMGVIPDQKPRCFQLNSNHLTSLPPELGLLTNLKWLNVRQEAHGY
jgi:hypothetical protein